MDRLAIANDGLAVAGMESLGIMWSDMHIKDPSVLIDALQPYKMLKHLFICFVEPSAVGQSFRKGNRVGGMTMSLVQREGLEIRGGFLLRILDEYKELAERMNEALAEAGKSTTVGVRMVRLEK